MHVVDIAAGFRGTDAEHLRWLGAFKLFECLRDSKGNFYAQVDCFSLILIRLEEIIVKINLGLG